jgi:putative ABC transport system substrate-binding protein
MTNLLLPVLLRTLSRVLPVTFLCVGFLASGLMSTQASAQQILAAIVTADLPRYQEVHEAMVKVLQAGGFGEDKVKIFTQSPNVDKMSLTNGLRRAEAAGATVIITYGSQSTALAQSELKNTPLLFADVYDPVALGTVKTLAAPGTDASGATSKTDMGTLVGSLMDIKAVKTVGVLYTKGEKGSEQQLAELEEQSKNFGFRVYAENARNPGEAAKLGAKLAAENEALFLTESVSVALQAKEIATSAQAGKCIIFSQIPGLVDAGALIGMEADLEEQGKLVAVHALQVLQGQKVHLLPVREAKKITLKINKQAAEQLGLTIPQTVASKAKIL